MEKPKHILIRGTSRKDWEIRGNLQEWERYTGYLQSKIDKLEKIIEDNK